MDHIKIIKRAFNLTWTYRALWIFGILLALTSGGGGGGGGSRNVTIGPGFSGFDMDLPLGVAEAIVVGVIFLVGLIFLFAIAAMLVRYVSETAVIRMVDEHEETGEQVSVRQGFRWGWSRPAFRIFLVDLLIGLSFLLIVILLLLIAAAPLLAWLTQSDTARALGTAMTIGLAVLVIMLAIVAGIAISLVVQFIRRVAVLEDLGVIDAMRRGLVLVRRQLGDVIVMGVLLFALQLLYTLLLIPVAIALVLVGLAIGGLPGLLAGGLTSLVASEEVAVLVGILVGLPIFILVLAAPLAFLGGLFEVFKSSTWTLTYRELIALEGSAPIEAGAGDSTLPEVINQEPKPTV